MLDDIFIHPTSEIEGATIGKGTKIWHFCHIMKAKIGEYCKFGQNCFVQDGVIVGNHCKIQNNVSLYKGVVLEDDVFIGPSVVFTNVRKPRASVNVPEENYAKTIVRRGATIGANATIVCPVEIGENAMIGAGSVITKNVPPGCTMVGNPAGVLINDVKGNCFVVSLDEYYVKSIKHKV